MTDKEILTQILTKLNSMDHRLESLESGQKELKSVVNELITDVKELKRKTDAIFKETAGLMEFKTETKERIENLEADVKLLKKLVVQ